MHHAHEDASRTSNATMNNGDPSNAEKGHAHYSHDFSPGGAPFYNRELKFQMIILREVTRPGLSGPRPGTCL